MAVTTDGMQGRLEDLARKLEHVLEPAMRRSLVLEWLCAASADEAYELLAHALRRGPPDSRPHDRLRDAVHGAVVEGVEDGTLAYRLRREVYERAARAEDETLMRILRTLPAADVGEPRLPHEIAEIPLGRRRSLARGDDPVLLEQLARDPDTVVVRHLLANPRLTEAQALRIAALRPVRASTLGELHRSARWWPRPRIRAALARNPFCPVEIALRAVGSLPRELLHEMRRDPDLHPEVVRQVAEELARRARR